MDTVLVSILIPAYNAEKWIKRAIESARAPNTEIIVYDDGSTDNTEKTARDCGVRVLGGDINRGISFARNRLLNAANGEYIAWLDADDEMHPEKIQKQMEFLRQNPDKLIVFTGYKNRILMPKNNLVKHEIEFEKINKKYFVSSLSKRELWDKIGNFDENIKLGEDSEILMRMACAGIELGGFIDEKLYTRNLHGNNSIFEYGDKPEIWKMFNGETPDLIQYVQNAVKNIDVKIPVSVIIPAFNAEKYIKQAIDSVPNDWEIIVVNDGSSDSTADYSNINISHSGISRAKNIGAKMATNPLLLFLDADDVLDTDNIIALSRLAKSDNNTGVHFAQRQNFMNDKFIGPPMFGAMAGCAIIKKWAFEKLGGFDENLTSGEALDFQLRLFKSDIKHVRIGIKTCNRRIHDDNYSKHNRDEEFRNYARILRAEITN